MHTQEVMSNARALARSRRRRLDAAVDEVPALMSLSARPVKVAFRGRHCTVLATPRTDVLHHRPQIDQAPITDVLGLELVSGSGEQPNWPRPVRLYAIIETGGEAVRAVHRATRWASYAARAAVVPEECVTEDACLEAALRGVWLITTGESTRVVVAGERGPVAGAARGLLHRLLDEVVLAAVVAAEIPAATGGENPRSESSSPWHSEFAG